MNSDILHIWQELEADLKTTAVLWQLSVIIASLAIAWMVNGALRNYVMTKAPEHWKIAIGSVNRMLFPLTTLVMVVFSQWVLSGWQHTSLLQLASRLLLAMAVVGTLELPQLVPRIQHRVLSMV